MTQDELKQAVAKAALDHVAPRLDRDSVIGVGTGFNAAPVFETEALSTTWPGFAMTSTARWPAPMRPQND